METANGFITEENILKLLVQRHVKPIIKEALTEFFKENPIISKEAPTAQLLTTNEVAKLFHVNRSYLYSLIKSGDIPTVMIGGAHKFRTEDLREYFRSRLNQKMAKVQIRRDS